MLTFLLKGRLNIVERPNASHDLRSVMSPQVHHIQTQLLFITVLKHTHPLPHPTPPHPACDWRFTVDCLGSCVWRARLWAFSGPPLSVRGSCGPDWRRSTRWKSPWFTQQLDPRTQPNLQKKNGLQTLFSLTYYTWLISEIQFAGFLFFPRLFQMNSIHFEFIITGIELYRATSSLKGLNPPFKTQFCLLFPQFFRNFISKAANESEFLFCYITKLL